MAIDRRVRKTQNGVRLFARHVTVCGLEEAYDSKYKYERIIFQTSLILASAAIIYLSSQVIMGYLEKGTVYDDLDIIGIQAPFPIITVCSPEAMNKSFISQRLTEGEYHRQRTLDLLHQFNVSLQEAIELLVAQSAFSVRGRPRLTPFTRAAMKLVEERASSDQSYFAYLFRAHPSCADMLGSCWFGSQPFDCCVGARQTPVDSSVCYQLNLSRIPEFSSWTSIHGGPNDDPTSLHSTGLSIEARIDWPDVVFFDNIAADGFIVFVEPYVTPRSLPIVLPSGMDAIVTLSSPKLVQQGSNCRTDSELDEGDPNGDLCIVKEVANNFREQFGCAIPASLDDMTGNEGDRFCTPLQLMQSLGALDGTVFAEIKENSSPLVRETYEKYRKKQEALVRSLGKAAYNKCLPLCSRFTYGVLSASYGSFHRHGQVNWTRERENESWSRIRIFFPSSSYRIHREKLISIGYMAVCEVGGVMGVYLGLSMVTLVQIITYGCLVCWDWKKVPSRVSPAAEFAA